MFSGVFIAGKVYGVADTTMDDVLAPLEALLNMSLRSACFFILVKSKTSYLGTTLLKCRIIK